jgi:hypothetical protein
LALVDENAEFLVNAEIQNAVRSVGRDGIKPCLPSRPEAMPLHTGEFALDDDDGLVCGVRERVLGHGRRLGLFGLEGKSYFFLFNEGKSKLTGLVRMYSGFWVGLC